MFFPPVLPGQLKVTLKGKCLKECGVRNSFLCPINGRNITCRVAGYAAAATWDSGQTVVYYLCNT